MSSSLFVCLMEAFLLGNFVRISTTNLQQKGIRLFQETFFVSVTIINCLNSKLDHDNYENNIVIYIC